MNLGGRIIVAIAYAMLVDHFGIFTYTAVWEFLVLVASVVVIGYILDGLLWLVKEVWRVRHGIIRSIRSGGS